MSGERSFPKQPGSTPEKAYPQPADEAAKSVASRAVKKEGGTGGISGTGQALPHHGFAEPEREALGNPVGEEAAMSTPDNGSTYQAGSTHRNRLRQEQTRKERLAGRTIANQGRGGSDAVPGVPAERR